MSDCIINRKAEKYSQAVKPAPNRNEDRQNIEVKCKKFPTAQYYSWDFDRKRKKNSIRWTLFLHSAKVDTCKTRELCITSCGVIIQQGREEQVIISAGIKTESFVHNSLELHPHVALTVGFVCNAFIILKSGKRKNSLAVGKHFDRLLACSRQSQRYLLAIALLTTLQIRSLHPRLQKIPFYLSLH